MEAVEIFDILSVLGGIPKCLELVNPPATAETYIKKLCFTPGGLLFDEFHDILDDVFGESCQIDLLLQTARIWWVDEVKRKREIGTEVIDEVSQKVKNLKTRPGTSVRTAIVYCGEFSKAVAAEWYFAVILQARDLLRPERG